MHAHIRPNFGLLHHGLEHIGVAGLQRSSQYFHRLLVSIKGAAEVAQQAKATGCAQQRVGDVGVVGRMRSLQQRERALAGFKSLRRSAW